jgi:hypothetical protein
MSDKEIETSLPNVPWMQKYAPILNFAGLFAWAIATVLLIWITATKEWIWINQLRYMGIVVVSVTYGILTMIAGIILVNIFTPWFSFTELFKGDGQSKIAGAIIFASIVLSIAIIFLAAN